MNRMLLLLFVQRKTTDKTFSHFRQAASFLPTWIFSFLVSKVSAVQLRVTCFCLVCAARSTNRRYIGIHSSFSRTFVRGLLLIVFSDHVVYDVVLFQKPPILPEMLLPVEPVSAPSDRYLENHSRLCVRLQAKLHVTTGCS
jgi:hypothetical protein